MKGLQVDGASDDRLAALAVEEIDQVVPRDAPVDIEVLLEADGAAHPAASAGLRYFVKNGLQTASVSSQYHVDGGGGGQAMQS